MRFLIPLFLFGTIFICAQNNYPQNYFSNPLDVPYVLAGTFAELRPNHFHAGLDIKTQKREGLEVKASATGFVSRIKVSHFGYGKALYIVHPNGYTTVYAHLKKFSPKIEAYVKKQQYLKESYEIELFPKPEELCVTKGDLIAYSGNTGGSSGPHLHFEIRDKQERPMNPLLFGFDIKDEQPPVISSLYVYPLDKNSSVNKLTTKQKLNLTSLENGNYEIKNLEAYGNIGFAIKTYDRQDLAANRNGVYNIETFINGTKNFELAFKRFSFNETKHINHLIDYAHYATKGERIQKLFVKNNPLSLYQSVLNQGVLSIGDSMQSVYKIKVSDYKQNASWITVHIKGEKHSILEPKNTEPTPHYIAKNKPKVLEDGMVSVSFYKDTFYEDFYIDFEVNQDTLKLHKDVVAAKKSFAITYDISKYKAPDKEKLYIARLIGSRKRPAYVDTRRKGDFLIAKTKKLGDFALATDITKPTISPKNFRNKQWLSKYRYLKLKINDSGSGISKYRATINGKWILTEYDYKTRTLTYDFNDQVNTETTNNLKVIVTDNVGNNSTFEAVFYRK